MTDWKTVEQLPAMIVQGRHVEVLTNLVHMMSGCIEGINIETGRVDKLQETVQSMSGHIRTLIDELTKVQGRELYLCKDEIIWHRDGDRMIPLTLEGDHVNPRHLRHRGSAAVQSMTRHEAYPTFTQLQEFNKIPLMRVTELDVVKLHVRRLEAQVRELAE